MGTKSRETIYGASIRVAAERATEARSDFYVVEDDNRKNATNCPLHAGA